MPIPEPTGQDARIEDLEIIATGDYNKIVARKDKLVNERDSITDKNSKEYKDLTARIDTLDAAAKKAKKDKNSKKSDDDLASWSGRVANASTNAFSASVNGVSVGLTGFSFAFGGFSSNVWIATESATAARASQTGTTFGVEGAVEKAAAQKLNAMATETDLVSLCTETFALATNVKNLTNIVSALHNIG